MSQNKRTTILLEEDESGEIRLKLTRSPNGKRGKGKSLPQELVLREPPGPDNARAHGAHLVHLLNQEKGTRAAILHALNAPAGEIWPLCIEIETDLDAVADLLWEALWVEKHDFLALRPQWPIARVVASADTSPARTYHAPVRILAVMSALGVSADEEWEGIRSAVDACRGVLPVHVTVVAGERQLLADLLKLESDPLVNADHWLTVVPLESQQTINWQLAKPWHIVHFYCHGTATAGSAHISFATHQDRAGDTESVVVDINRLEGMVANGDLWLVTLNCCSGAQSVGATQTLAQSLVEAGAGAALGWRTPIHAEDAHILSGTVYHGLLRYIAKQLDSVPENKIVELELATLGFDLREALHAKCVGPLHWALPVLFVADRPLSITPVAKTPDDPKDLRKLGVDRTDNASIAEAVAAKIVEEFNKGRSASTPIQEVSWASIAQQLLDSAPPTD